MKMFLSFLLLISLPTFAQIKTASLTAPTATLSQVKVTPFNVEHAENGCPSNSYCTPFAGELRKKWVLFLDNLTGPSRSKIEKIENYRKKTGIPLTAWVKAEMQKEKDVVSFDSRCLHHQKEGNILFYSEIMGTDIFQLKDRKFLFDQAHTILKGNVARSYIIPREEYPLYVDGDDVVVLREDEGIYYGVKITPAGITEVVETATLEGDDYPTDTDCPEPLVRFAKDKEKGRNLYIANPFCKKIKNIKTKEQQIFLFIKACN